MAKKSILTAGSNAVTGKGSFVSKEQLMTKVKAKAYEFWEKQGRKNGNDRAHWFEAERIVKSQAN